MVGIFFAVVCALMLRRLWRRPWWGPHAYASGGYGHPRWRGRHGRCGGPPCGGAPSDAASDAAPATPNQPAGGDRTQN